MANVEWYLEQDSDLIYSEDYYAGSYRPNDTMQVILQVWNNRWGQTAVDDITNAKLTLAFDTYEDSALLSLCTVSIDESDFVPLIIQGTKGYINIGTLSGAANNGTQAQGLISNCRRIVLKFGPVPSNLQNGLKNLFLNVEYI